MSHDNTRPASSSEDIHLALLEHGAHLGRLWLGSTAPQHHLETAVLLAERLMILLGEAAEEWWHAHQPLATSHPELQGIGCRAIPVAVLQTERRSITVDLGRLVRELAADTGYAFDDVLLALIPLKATHTPEEFGQLTSYTALTLVDRWRPEVQAWLADEQTTRLPLPSLRGMH